MTPVGEQLTQLRIAAEAFRDTTAELLAEVLADNPEVGGARSGRPAVANVDPTSPANGRTVFIFTGRIA